MAIILNSEKKSPKMRGLYCAIFAFLCIGAIIQFMPLIWLFLGTFKSEMALVSAKPTFLPESWSITAYREAFSSFDIGKNVYNTIFFSGTIIICQTITSTLAAFSLSRIKMKCSMFFYMLILGTQMFNSTTLLFTIYIQLTTWGLIGNKMAWILMASGWGYAIVLYKNFFDSIPKELFEAADIDGAGTFQQIIHIMVPLAKPIYAVNILSTFMAVYNEFLLPTMIYPDEKDWTLMMRIFMMDKEGGIATNVMYVLLFVTTIPSIIFYLFAQKNIVQGVTSSGIKG